MSDESDVDVPEDEFDDMGFNRSKPQESSESSESSEKDSVEKRLEKPRARVRKPDKRRGHKIKHFKKEWLDQSIQGKMIRSWCSIEQDPRKAHCNLCNCQFSVAEGWSALVKHDKGKKHMKLKDIREKGEDENRNTMYVTCCNLPIFLWGVV